MSDIEKLLSAMTLDEKISMLAGKDLWHSMPIPRLGIPSIKVTDGPNGVRGASRDLGPPSACLPVGTALGATWNVDLVERLGKLLAEEIQLKSAHILLAPTVNIHRTPIAGRNFECFSEDPYLSGQMAAAYINGIQNNGAGACIKHFVCNDQGHYFIALTEPGNGQNSAAELSKHLWTDENLADQGSVNKIIGCFTILSWQAI